MNGHLCVNCHGARYVLLQLVHTITMRQILIVKGNNIAERSGSPELVAFIHTLCGKPNSICMIEVKGGDSKTDSVDSTFGSGKV